MAQSEQTEQPTQRRLDKARKEGNFPVSKELIGAVHFAGVVTLVGMFSGGVLTRLVHMMRHLLEFAFAPGFSQQRFVAVTRTWIAPDFVPLILGGLGLMVAMVAIQLASTKLGVSFSKLAPDFKRLNPMPRITGLPAQNLPMLLQALLLIPLVSFVLYYELTENLDAFLELSWLAPPSALARVSTTVHTLLWRAAGLFLLIGIADLLWQRHRYTGQLKMSKQEIKEEHKESEGNPQIKQRVRRIQRDMARKQMMKEVSKATAVIVNPTHYAVAIRYTLPTQPGEIASAPRVAARIRKRAFDHQVPIIENPPLARALYKSVDVGQEIPAHLYRAVAEILAYIYKLMNGRLPG
jgi:flagellar biosynthesis protein FlhB